MNMNMNVQKLFRRPLFGIFLLFGIIAVSTSWVCIATVDSQLSEEYESNSRGIAHTFVPGIPEVILASDPANTESVERQLSGADSYVEVGSPILAGVAGTVHIGMDKAVISLKIQQAVGRQMYLISSIFLVGIIAAILLMNLAAKPVENLLAYAVELARAEQEGEAVKSALLERDDEAGQLARLFLYFSRVADSEKTGAGAYPRPS